MPANADSILGNPGPGTKAGFFYNFSQFHVINNFHSKTPVRSAGFVGRTPQHLKRTHANIEPGRRITHAMGIGSQLKCHSKKSYQNRLPKTAHVHIAKQR